MTVYIEFMLSKDEQVNVFRMAREVTFAIEEHGDVKSFQMVIKEDEDADSRAVQGQD